MKNFIVILIVFTAFDSTALAKPTIASINLCTDRLVLKLADRSQIASLSFVSADKNSMVNKPAVDIPLNHGSLEELINIDADIFLASEFDNRLLLNRLRDFGRHVVAFNSPKTILQAIDNVKKMGDLLDQRQRAEKLVEALSKTINQQPFEKTIINEKNNTALIISASGYISGEKTLAGDLLKNLGFINLAGSIGITHTRQITLEQIIHTNAHHLVLNQYSLDYSQAQSFLSHPALSGLKNHSQLHTIPTSEWICGDHGLLKVADRLEFK